MEKLISSFKFLLLIGFISTFSVFTGCKDDDGNGGTPSPADNLIGTWTVDNADLTLMVGNQSLSDFLIDAGASQAEAELVIALFEAFLLAEVTGSITFKNDNTYISNFGGSPDDGTWNLSADGKTLTLDAGTVDEIVIDVVSLTSTTANMIMSQTIMQDLDDDPLTPDVPIDVEANMTLSK